MTEPKSEPKKPAAEPAPLARAAESSDPTVHAIIAEMQTHLSNGDDTAVAGCVTRLAALGYE